MSMSDHAKTLESMAHIYPHWAPACLAGADALRREPRYRAVLEQLATNELSDENCASVEVAGARVRGLARQALNAPTEPTR